MPLSFVVWLIYRRGLLHVLPLGAILLLAAVHATLALLPGSEGLRAKVDAQLSPWLSGGVVLHSGGHGKQCFSAPVHITKPSDWLCCDASLTRFVASDALPLLFITAWLKWALIAR